METFTGIIILEGVGLRNRNHWKTAIESNKYVVCGLVFAKYFDEDLKISSRY